MKFGKQFTEYQSRTENCIPRMTYIDFKKLKKLLKRYREHRLNEEKALHDSQQEFHQTADRTNQETRLIRRDSRENLAYHFTHEYTQRQFVDILNKDLEAVVGSLSSHARKLVRAHLASKGRKLLSRLRGRNNNVEELLLQGKFLMSYALMNHMAICKIMKKYAKVYGPSYSEELTKNLHDLHQRLLHCPFLIELDALLINLEKKINSRSATPLTLDASTSSSTSFFLSSEDNAFCSPSLITKQDYVLPLPRSDTDFTCPICLEILYDPVSLGCGHMMCYSCACSAGNAPSSLGIHCASKDAKCPVCRQVEVYQSAVRLPEVNLLVKTKYPELWLEREKMEKTKEVERVKAFWDNEMADTFSAYGIRV